MSYLLFDFVKTNAFSLHSSDVSSQKNLRWAHAPAAWSKKNLRWGHAPAAWSKKNLRWGHAPAAWSKKNLRRRDAPVCKGGDQRFLYLSKRLVNPFYNVYHRIFS